TSRQLAELMVGSELPTPETRDDTVTDEVVLDISDLTVRHDDRPVLEDVSIAIRRGEILGIAGVEGNGQTPLIAAILGLEAASEGTITLLDDDITHWSTRRRR